MDINRYAIGIDQCATTYSVVRDNKLDASFISTLPTCRCLCLHRMAHQSVTNGLEQFKTSDKGSQ